MIESFIYLAEITGRSLDDGSEKVFRFSSGQGFTTSPTDTPANTPYDIGIDQPIEVTRSIYQPGTTEGRSKVGFGDLVLLNPDGSLDHLLRYAFDGRDVVVRRGKASASLLSEFTDVFVGTMEQAEFSVTRITFKLRDKQAALMLPLQSNTYSGDNALPAGLEGTSGDLAGKTKPLPFGIVKNAPAPCVNTARLIYQPKDGTLASVDAVRDRGIALVNAGTYASLADLQNDALAPLAGTYKSYLAGGYVRLGSSPVGAVTFDVTEGATGADRTAAALFRRVLQYMGVDLADIRSSDLTTLDAKNSAPIGIWIDSDIRASDVLDQIANTVGAWWGVDASGKYRIVRLERPKAPVSATFTANDIIGPPTRISTADPERGVPAYRVTVRYARNYTVQSDLAAGVSDADRAYLAQEYREASAVDASVQLQHLLAVALTYDTLFANEADALTEARRRLALRAVQRHRFEIVSDFNTETAAVDIGDTVGLGHPRFGLNLEGEDDGLDFIVLGVDPDARDGRVKFTLWGSSLTAVNLVTNAGAFLVTDDGAYLITDTR